MGALHQPMAGTWWISDLARFVILFNEFIGLIILGRLRWRGHLLTCQLVCYGFTDENCGHVWLRATRLCPWFLVVGSRKSVKSGNSFEQKHWWIGEGRLKRSHLQKCSATSRAVRGQYGQNFIIHIFLTLVKELLLLFPNSARLRNLRSPLISPSHKKTCGQKDEPQWEWSSWDENWNRVMRPLISQSG